MAETIVSREEIAQLAAQDAREVKSHRVRLPIEPGKAFNRLTVLYYIGGKKWLCQCSCGKLCTPLGSALVRGRTKSCGCLHRPHGHAGMRGPSATYRSWASMRDRCLDSEHKAYKHYGGKGIRICDAWLNDFSAFLRDMGERPEGTTLERRDNSKDYGPSNCRWATWIEQAANRSTNRHVTAFGRTLNLAEWSREFGIAPDTISRRIGKGWLPEVAVKKPSHSGKFGPEFQRIVRGEGATT